jgi:hypothetical protein
MIYLGKWIKTFRCLIGFSGSIQGTKQLAQSCLFNSVLMIKSLS